MAGAGQMSVCEACAGLCGSDVSVPEWLVWLALPVVLFEICKGQMSGCACAGCWPVWPVSARVGLVLACVLLCGSDVSSVRGFCWCGCAQPRFPACSCPTSLLTRAGPTGFGQIPDPLQLSALLFQGSAGGCLQTHVWCRCVAFFWPVLSPSYSVLLCSLNPGFLHAAVSSPIRCQPACIPM